MVQQELLDNYITKIRATPYSTLIINYWFPIFNFSFRNKQDLSNNLRQQIKELFENVHIKVKSLIHHACKVHI